jgi:CheY-like chemotaxis protein
MATILLVDDDDDVRTATQMMLERAGHDVESLPDGRRVLERCRARAFDAVVTDVVMPEQEGIETIRTLRQKDPDIVIIAISGGGGYGSGAQYLQTAELIGADATFEKPVSSDRLCSTIDELIAAREA